MNRKNRFFCVVALLAVSGFAVNPAAAQQASTDELREEIRELQKSLKAIQEELQEIKRLLARQVPPPSGIGAVVDYGSSPSKGESTAKLTLVEFSDYQ